jgi:Na+/H+ antiporter NhaD/arsenite permease-like protein
MGPALPPPVYWVAPFAALLAAIAFLPLAMPHHWDSNRVKLGVVLALGAPVGAYYLAHSPAALIAVAEEYVSFILLLTALYVIAGGVRLTGDLVATPATNTAFLGAGAILASLVGTTGASMLLVRPVLETNQERARATHTMVFFIFLVANVGGCLTPLGDPPLLLGYLRGVPFTWTLRLWPHWLLMIAVLLLVYFVWDSTQYARERMAAIRRDRSRPEPLRIRGAMNALWLAGVVLAVAFVHAPMRELVMLAWTGISLWQTPREIRHANRFTSYPIVEVAVLFFGIFLTMIPALELLQSRGHELGVRQPWQFFWASGMLSSFLDNAPTYLVFLALGQGLGLPPDVVGVPASILAAISVGAVAMGANTYIGNAPNFMVKSIAEESGVKMPSFLGYMLYSGLVLIPLFIGITFLFF